MICRNFQGHLERSLEIKYFTFTICLKIALKTNCKLEDIYGIATLMQDQVRSKSISLLKLGDGDEGRSA